MHINTKSTYSRKVNFMLLYASLNKNWPLIWLINKSLSFLRCGFISEFEIEFLSKRDWNSAFTIPTYDVHEKGRSDEVLNLAAME